MRSRLLLLSLLVAAPLAHVAPAAAATSVGLDVGLTGFRDIQVDEAHGRAFISQGTATVVVTDLAGNAQAPLTDLPGASGLALSDDGATLWVALSGANAVAAIDTTTLTRQIFPTGEGTCPSTVAETAGFVWFGGACDGQWGSLRALDPATGTVSGSLASAYNPLVVTSPALPGEVFSIEKGLSPAKITAWTASTDPEPALTARASTPHGGPSNGRDLAITPDGSTIVLAAGYPYEHGAYSTTDLAAAGSYPSTNYPNAVSIAPDGRVAAGVDGAYSDDIFLSGPDQALLRSFEVGPLAERGLAWAGDTILAVTGDTWTPYRLHVVASNPVEPETSYVSVATNAEKYAYRATARVAVTLRTSSENRTVSLYKTTGGVTSLVKTGTVPVDGKLVAEVVVGRRTKFHVEYAGDEAHLPDTASRSVYVHAKVNQALAGYRFRDDGFAVYRPGDRITQNVKVAPNKAEQCVAVELQIRRDGVYRNAARIDCVTLSAESTARAVLDTNRDWRGVRMRFRALKGSDADNLYARSTWAYARVTR